MDNDDKTLDADSPEAIEISNFDNALGAELASDLESTDTAKAEDGDDKKETPSDDSKSEDASAKKVEDKEEEEPSEEEGEEEDEETKDEATGKVTEKVVKLPAAPPQFPDLKDGDYAKNADGTHVVNDDVLAQDISVILNDNAGVYLKIYKAKPAKAEAMAQILGFHGDDTRSPGRQMADVVKALKEGEKDQTERLLVQHFPYLLDPNAVAPFTFAEGVESTRKIVGDVKVEDAPVDPSAYSEGDLKGAIYQVVAESEGKLKIGDIKMDELKDEMEQFKFDPATGKPMPLYERLSLAVEGKFPVGESESNDDEDDDTRKVPTGGNRKKSSSKKDKEDPKMKDFSDALASQMGSF